MIVDHKIIVEDSNACTGEFVIYSLLELYLRNQNNGVIFVAASQSFSHYQAVLKKLTMIDSSQLVYLDQFGKPFDYNVFDNLPLSQAIPNTHTSKLPKKVQFQQFTLVDSDQMLDKNFKSLFTKIEKSLKQMQNDGKQVLVLVDNINIMINGCYTKSELDFIEIMNEFTAIADRDARMSVAIGVNRDLFDCESTMDLDFYREIKNSVFDSVYELNRNLSGYSRDVHGQLNIIRNKHNIGEQSVKNVKFRLTENKVELFEHFTI
ncbi:elongator protein 6 [Stylonychia lemnae]|uniref:Elongator protein 6 n=1 Tax=Stylonychia lemnae TaxID=5949 RepID=A0A078AN41_STYLE|nr:elongator protein 6 [Stylonychia lemnae]|eukprot:CDW83780.1 elongator protein 6 [Stylonychia lemnae]